MTLHAREVLEFPRVLAGVAGRAASPQGRRHVEALKPLPIPLAREELDRVRAVMDFMEEKPSWALPVIPELDGVLERLQVEGGVLDPAQLLQVGRLLTAAGEIRREMSERPELDPHLAALRDRLFVAGELEKDIARTVDDDGTILDSASRELKAIRARLRGAHQRIVKRLEGYMGELSERIRVPDASVSVREGRYVIPVRREGRREVGGIIHDESGTGSTIFVEPPVAVELMNELRELERAEAREIQRILREFSKRLHPFVPELDGSMAALVELDSLSARARAALAWRADPPELADDARSGFQVVQGRHPLLLQGDVDVVPFDLAMGPHERTLVVSGPNTGGKSVFLKAMGLLTLLARSGVVPPVGRGTVLPGVSAVYADIGDEQSIAASLSTFSAHLANLKEILEGADQDALVLMDELGTGTDPAEGAALARTVLETLTNRGCLTLATSHLGALKVLDREDNGIVNASMQFDPKAMAPTYRLEKGRPGRSYGLAIARRLGLPEDILEQAQGFMDEGTASLEDLLERLELREREARERAAELQASQGRVKVLEAEVASRERKLKDRERSAEERARQQARDLLLSAREEVEEAIRAVQEAGADAVEGAARDARRRVEQAADRQRKKKARVQKEKRARKPDRESLEPGARVRVGSGATKGTLAEIREDRAVVEVSGLRMEVPLADLEVLAPAGSGGAARARGKGTAGATAGGAGRDGASGTGSAGASGSRTSERGWSGAIPTAGYEIDLRGLRVDEVELNLARSLDGAILNDLNEVRIIHGKGTGAVKGRVRELLQADARVASFRDGHPREGGTGVTLAVFR